MDSCTFFDDVENARKRIFLIPRLWNAMHLTGTCEGLVWLYRMSGGRISTNVKVMDRDIVSRGSSPEGYVAHQPLARRPRLISIKTYFCLALTGTDRHRHTDICCHPEDRLKQVIVP